MFLKQLSVFLENREGRVKDVLKVLKDNDINIVSLSLADSSDYGLLRLIVDCPKKSKEILSENGFTAVLNDVIVVKIAHKAGKLQEVLEVLCECNVNIEYMYALSTGSDDASIVIKASDIEKAAKAIEESSLEIVSKAEIRSM